MITAIFKYTTMDPPRKLSLRFHIMELEVISQFIMVLKVRRNTTLYHTISPTTKMSTPTPCTIANQTPY